MRLDPRATAAGVRLIAHERLGSTNAEALDLARKGERGPLWITADHQSEGRGRRGRIWTSKRGNLHATLLLTDPGPAEHWPELSFVAALALHDAIVEIMPDLKPKLSIKWPNDLLISGEKFAGILIEGESVQKGAGEGSVAVGFGVNCTNHPKDTEYPATHLSAAGAKITAARLFTVLGVKMLGRLAQWHGGEGFSTIRADWLARVGGIGQTLRVRLADRELSGRFDTLDEDGRLVLMLADGSRETVAAGDVVSITPSPGGGQS